MANIRQPVVAGQFYEGTEKALLGQLRALCGKESKRERAIGVVSPHAGYVYSGAVAACVFSSIEPADSYVMIGPNHTGLGGPFGLSGAESWRTPLGDVRVDRDLAELIKSDCRLVKYDDLSHAHEHSVEVQLPVMQYLLKDFKIVPITVAGGDLDTLRELGESIARSIKRISGGRSVTMVASSDMTHYETQESARRKDSAAIKAIVAMDEARLLDVVAGLDISMCGYAPCAMMLSAAKRLGAARARLLDYRTSAEASGDYSSVVGYAGVIVS